MSARCWRFSTTICMPDSACAAACTSLHLASAVGLFGFMSTPIVAGISLRNSSSFFGSSAVSTAHARDIAARPVEAGTRPP